jgi:ABC-type dipeptide/oligopeptide/nickel transport system permease subunit
MRRLLRKRIAVVCLVVIAIFYFCGAFAPWIAPYGYAEQNLDASFEGPSWEHPFGTDRNGRDVFSRVLYATRTTLIVTLATVAAGSVVLPLTLGMLSGYRGGWVDTLIQRTGEILASLPGLPMLVLISATLRPRFVGWVEDFEDAVGWHGLTESGFADYFLIFFVLSLFGWVGGARLIRTQVLTMRGSEHVIAARASGATTTRILFRHLLPNVMPLVIVGVSAALGAIALSEIGLTFLGVGIQPPHPSFGALISDGAARSTLENHPQLLLVPAVIVATQIFAFNLLGDSLNDVLTPRAR